MPDRVSKNSSNIATLRALTSRNTDSDQTCAYEPMLLNLMLLMYIVTNNSNKLEISAIIKGVIGWDSSGHVLVHAFVWLDECKETIRDELAQVEEIFHKDLEPTCSSKSAEPCSTGVGSSIIGSRALTSLSRSPLILDAPILPLDAVVL